MQRTIIVVILVLLLLILLWFVYRKNFKKLTPSAVNLTTGAPKTGKTLLNAPFMARKDFIIRHRIWWIKTKIFRVVGLEEPLFYTNQAFSFGNLKKIMSGKRKPHRLDRCIVKISTEHLERKVRFNYKSVICITESSLLADNQDVNNQYRNAELSLFNKLIGHETRGGVIYYDTQNTKDNHYSIKRVCSTYWLIQKSKNFWLFRVLYVRECISDDIGENNFTSDVDDTTKKIIIFRWHYKHYDQYYFSYLTDDLPISNEIPVWYEGELDSFNPIYRKISKKGVNTNEKTI